MQTYSNFIIWSVTKWLTLASYQSIETKFEKEIAVEMLKIKYIAGQLYIYTTTIPEQD